ncbi:Uncharacterized protein APZ42_022486 [Daphnia magna]|uniref:Uncharacterized protein n=1 Tax=Daphnia magna TaxID=35525 RepID=A0A164VJL3_9CRUS|nr:Uncharacterized protein APZ42_022486 [Daphnia magna]
MKGREKRDGKQLMASAASCRLEGFANHSVARARPPLFFVIFYAVSCLVISHS